MDNERWTLIATNKSGAQVIFRHNIKKRVVELFDSEYKRTGWRISLYDNEQNGLMIAIKRTFK